MKNIIRIYLANLLKIKSSTVKLTDCIIDEDFITVNAFLPYNGELTMQKVEIETPKLYEFISWFRANKLKQLGHAL